MIYLALGEAVRRGIPLYGGIHDNKPPLLYITAAVAGNLFWFKAILAIWHLATVFLFWKLSEALFKKNEKLQIISTVLFAIFTTIPLLEGNIANAELFMIGPTIGAFLILLKGKLNFKNLFISGLLFSIATLFKVPAAFDIPAIVFLWLVSAKKLGVKNIKQIAINTGLLFVGFATPIIITFVWYALRGAFSEYLIAAFLQNVGYLSSWRPEDVREPFLTRNGPLLVRAGVVTIGFLILYKLKNKLSREFIFLSAWLLLTLFAVTLSERPYPHYLVQSVPPAALLFGMLFTLNRAEQVYTIIPLTILFFVPVYYNFWYYKTVPYYRHFYKFARGQINKQEYFAGFGGHINRNYEIARFISGLTKRGDKVFVWGPDSSMIYALSRRLPPGRYVADYHINDFSSPKETVEVLQNDMPLFFVMLPEAPYVPDFRVFLNKNYGLIEKIDGAEVWKLLKPSIRALLSDEE